jgi:putative FmdB family regulatory protein
MPIYEYECTKCGNHEEVIQKFSDKPLKKCGHCSGKLNKLVSQSSFHLKGTGWYVTDYANKSSSTGTASKDSKPKENTTKEKKVEASAVKTDKSSK